MKITIICICFALFIITTTAENFKCNEGDERQVDCNFCRCVRGGFWVCTKKHCIQEQSKETCKDGDRKKIECNSCVCSNGKWQCTSFSCKSVDRIAYATRRIFCVPGETFKIDCNYCRCLKDGRTAACTLQACPKS